MKLFRWKGRTNFKGFKERFQEAVLLKFPAATFEDDDEFGVKVGGLASGNTHNIWLERAYKEFVAQPADADEIIGRWLVSIERGERGKQPVQLDLIVPMVKDLAWLKAQQANGNDDGIAFESYNCELVVAYAEHSNGGLAYLRQPDLGELNLSLDALRARAIETLRTRLKPRSVTGRHGVYLIGVGGTFEASLLLLDDLWRDARMQIVGSPLVAIPDRDSFLVGDDSDPDAIWNMALVVAKCYEQEPYPISPSLYHRVGERFEPLDPQTNDDEHPIPVLDVIDVFVKHKERGGILALVIATPLQANARSIFRLFRKLNGYASFIASDAYRADCGEPDPGCTFVQMSIHPDSDPRVFDLVAGLEGWAANRKFAIELKPFNETRED